MHRSATLALLFAGSTSALAVPLPLPVSPARGAEATDAAGGPFNVLFLFGDDHQPDAIGALGHPDLRTPSLDRLVGEGFTFTNAYCFGSTSGAVCGPSRAMLMSGRTLWHLEGNVFDLRGDDVLLPEAFGGAGYQTFATGKWHNGRTSFQRAFEGGDEIFFGGMGDHLALGVHDYDPSGAYPNEARTTIASFSSQAFADAAIRFLDERDRERPFFAYVSFTAPHDPRMAPDEFRSLYAAEDLELPPNFRPAHPFDNGELRVRDERLAPWPRTPAVVREHLAEYYAMISHLDHQVGRLLDALDERGLAETTFVVYAADHGLAVGQHGLLGKQNLYEHSLGAPLVIRGPGVPAGRRSAAFAYLHDLYPTLCELAGIPAPDTLEGRSLAPILTGASERVRSSTFGAYRRFQRSVRFGNWKLIAYPRVGELQLFDLAVDPFETTDRAEEPELQPLVAELRNLLRTWQERVDDPHPLPAERPNVVMFVVDDLGWQDTSLALHSERTPFNERYRTPSMERLAASGLAFTNGYAASPVCTPTRTSWMTGLHPARSGITDWTLRGPRNGGHAVLDPPPDWNWNGLSNDPATPNAVCVRTLPELLRSAGYRTIHVGKAHLGAIGTPGADPTNLGFERNVAGHAAGAPGSHLGQHDYSARQRGGDGTWDVPGLEPYHGTDTVLTEALTREALRELDAAVADGRPFFLHLSHYTVHAPIEPDARFVDEYAALDPREARYASMIEGMDASLGAVLDRLDEHGIADDTLVLFVSDNGGLSAHGRGGEPHTHNAPLASGKGSALEGGTRVPMVVRWPGVTRPGTRTDVPITTCDWFPTLLAATGALPAELHAHDGLDLRPLLAGDATPAERPLFWHYPHAWGPTGPGIEPYSAIRRGRFKLVHFYPDGRNALFDLAADLSESRDLAAQRPELARGLAAELGAWLRSVDAPRPVFDATGEPTPWP